MNADRIWHPYTNPSERPESGWPVIARGEGIHLFDESGRRYVDAISSWWACALGHADPRVAAAIARQAAALPHSILGNLSNRPALDLAETLCSLMPTPDRRVHFASDGASAVEAALKIAIQYMANTGRAGKNRLAALDGAYHGDTLGAVAVGGPPGFREPFRDLLFEPVRVPVPRPADREDECLRAAAAGFEAQAGRIAALVVEPLCQGAAGMRMYSPRYLAALADLCRRHDALLIADEIATGFGRTGRMFAFEHAGIDPDIVCVGKALSAGTLPVSAAIVRDAVYRAFDGRSPDRLFRHGHTFAGNPIACAAALESLRILRGERLPERAARLGGLLRKRLAPWAARPGVREARALGLIGAIEFEDEGGEGAARAGRVRDALRRRGVLVRPLGAVVYLMPPLVIRDDEFDRLVADFLEAAGESESRGRI